MRIKLNENEIEDAIKLWVMNKMSFTAKVTNGDIIVILSKRTLIRVDVKE